MDSNLVTILNMSITGGVVILAVCAFRLLLRKAPKAISYALWLVVAFRLIVPFSFESMFSLMPMKPNPIPQDIVYQEAPRIDTGIQVVDNAVSSSLPAPAPDEFSSVNPIQIYLAIGELLWLVGVAAMLVYSVVSIAILKRRLRGSAHMRENIYESDNLRTPFVLGSIRPRIYIPAGLKPGEKDYIILHEQTHIRRKDHLVKLVAYLVLCVHWFNPLVWLAFVLMGTDMEMSCDERVLRTLGSDIKKDYSLSLLSLATERRIINGSPLAFGEGGMKSRIKNVLNFRKPSRLLVIAAIVLSLAVGIGCAANRAEEITLREFEAIYSDVTEYSYSIQFEYGGLVYSPYVVDGELQTAGDMRGAKEIGFAVGNRDDKYRMYERAGFSVDEFIVVKDDGFMNPLIIYTSLDSEVPDEATVDPVEESVGKTGDGEDDSKLLSSWTPLADLPVQYNMDAAIADGVYVNVYGNEIYNQELVDAFHTDVSAGRAAFMRVVRYTIEGDAMIADYQFDGDRFTVSMDNTRDKWSSVENRVISTATYQYLIPPQEDAPEYYLSNELNIFVENEYGDIVIDGHWVPSPSPRGLSGWVRQGREQD